MSPSPMWVQGIGGGLVLLGAAFTLLAALGVTRLPDVYCRAHALGKASTMGFICLCVGYGVFTTEPSWLKLGAAIVFQLTSIPLAGHLFCLVAMRRGAPRHQPRAPHAPR